MSLFSYLCLNSKRRGFQLLCCRFKTYYEVLSVPKDASREEIRDSFLALSKKYHPDTNHSHPPAKELFIEINEAYSTLINPSLRRLYDEKLAFPAKYPPRYPHSHGMNKHYGSDWRTYGFSSSAKKYSDYDYGFAKRGNEAAWSDYYQEKRQKHWRVIFYLVLLMFVASGVQSRRVYYAHKEFQKRSDRESMKNQLIYQSLHEKAKNSTLEEQLAPLTERIGRQSKNR